MSGGHPEAPLLLYVGRLGAGAPAVTSTHACACVCAHVPLCTLACLCAERVCMWAVERCDVTTSTVLHPCERNGAACCIHTHSALQHTWPLNVRTAEKNLAVIKGIMEQVPGCRLAFVGDGPQRKELEQTFAGMPVVFMVSRHHYLPSVVRPHQSHWHLGV